MRDFLKSALIVCLALATLLAALFIVAWLWYWRETVQVEAFYREHRILGEMRAAQKDSTNDSVPAREALLKIVPIGTGREAAIKLLKEGRLDCQGFVGPITCQTMSPNVIGSKQWIVTLEFDADERLSKAHVAIWNIFL